MELIGDLERAFATAIYPNRVLLAVAGIVLFAIVVAFAWRRRWDLEARRRPRRMAAGIAIGLAILGPLGWYLGSPLFLSSTIDEPPPRAEVVSHTATPIATLVGSEPTATPSASPAPVERAGAFTGADDFHFGRGTARLIETAPGTFAVRLENFAVRNGPDLYVYLSPSADGYTAGAVELGRLKADRGNQNYSVPPEADVASGRSVVIWCKQFGVLFATAPLT
ncbi:MAG: DM13 domain-containing protein [Chloroflexota bacterium]|nr:DM13 domain-containing protein [Chloroflexota bacterium]